MTIQQYETRLRAKGYRVKENLTFLETPYGLWIQKIVEDSQGFGLVSVLNPCYDKHPEFRLTDTGERKVEQYIRELKAKRKEILDAGKDTAEYTYIPVREDIIDDINELGIDSDGEYVNGWQVTDNYDADYPLLLKIGRDLEVA